MICRTNASGARRQESGVGQQASGIRRQVRCDLQFALVRQGMIAPVAVSAMLLAGAAGCGPATSAGYNRYVPSAERAEAALRQVLEAWQDGETVTELTFNDAPIKLQVADSTRRPGQRLVDYQLLGEISGEGPRTFVVRLKLENPNDEQEVRYYLVGIDPLWVFRQEDYDAIAHWDACVRADDGDDRAKGQQ